MVFHRCFTQTMKKSPICTVYFKVGWTDRSHGWFQGPVASSELHSNTRRRKVIFASEIEVILMHQTACLRFNAECESPFLRSLWNLDGRSLGWEGVCCTLAHTDRTAVRPQQDPGPSATIMEEDIRHPNL